MPRSLYALFAPLLIAALAVYEVAHNVLYLAWPGYRPLASLIFDVAFVPLWFATAVLILLKRPVGRVLAVLSAATLVSHGVGVCLGGSGYGSLFALGGLGVTGAIIAQGVAGLSARRWEADRRVEVLGTRRHSGDRAA